MSTRNSGSLSPTMPGSHNMQDLESPAPTEDLKKINEEEEFEATPRVEDNGSKKEKESEKSEKNEKSEKEPEPSKQNTPLKALGRQDRG